MNVLNPEGLQEVPESRPQNYVVDVFSERTGQPIYYVNDATMEELRDMVCFYHAQLEEVKKAIDSTKTVVDNALGYDEL